VAEAEAVLVVEAVAVLLTVLAAVLEVLAVE
jgi:hypothetical protein